MRKRARSKRGRKKKDPLDRVDWTPWEVGSARVRPDKERGYWGEGWHVDTVREALREQESVTPEHLSGWSVVTRTIPEAPAPRSGFKTHDRVAGALVQTITSSDMSQNVVLTGALGSGKTTVVDMMERRLEKREKEGEGEYRVFTYDLWVHRSESVRRSFIEELARFLEGERWIDADTSREAKSYVLEQKTESSSQITIFGILITILLATLPPSILLMRAGKDDVIAESFPIFGSIDIHTGVAGAVVTILILSVLIVSGVIFLIFRGIRKIRGRENADGPNLLNGETSVTIEELDASTVDFRDAFDGLVGTALQHTDRKLAIVIDNLDRFTPEDVYEFWTNLQTFFELSRNGGGEGDSETHLETNWRNRCWTILPFSPRAPYRLQKTLGGTSGMPQKPFGEYIDKTFQIQFRIPAPVQSDFEDFFMSQFHEAIKIPGDQNTARRVRDLFFHFLYDYRNSETTVQPVPRAVNRFLNDLVASIRQYGQTPSVPVQAFFLLLKRTFGSALTPNKIESGKDLGLRRNGFIIGMREKALIRQLLVLHFGVREEKVSQILIRGNVWNAMLDGTEQDIHEYKTEIGFKSVVREEVLRIRASSRGERPAMAARALKDVDSTYLPVGCWSMLIRASEEATAMGVRSERVGQGLNVLIEKQSVDQRESLERSILNLVSTLQL